MTILAVIPARGSSKRLPGKNAKLLAGKPLIQWTVEAALGSNCIDRTLVSSDSSDIINLANSFGDLAPYKRPGELATDISSSVDVAKHALEYAESEGLYVDYLAFLQPTSPLRTAAHVDEAISRLLGTTAISLASVCKCEKSPLWSARLSNAGALDFVGDESSLEMRSQDLPNYYSLNGAIYLISTSFLRKNNTLFDVNNCIPYIMSRECSIDIDTISDFRTAENFLENCNSTHD